MKIVFATNNQHKLSEIRQILGDRIEILSLNDIGCHDDIPETASTLEGNAWQKAQYIYDHYHLSCFADDTGLEVDALDGAPGVFSARYAGEPKPTTTTNPFTDIKEGAYYYNAVLWAAENDITNGTTKTTFDPEKTCTRAQIVTFLYRYNGKKAAG